MNEAFLWPILLAGMILLLIVSVYSQKHRDEDISGWTSIGEWIVFFASFLIFGGGGLAAMYFFQPFPDSIMIR